MTIEKQLWVFLNLRTPRTRNIPNRRSYVFRCLSLGGTEMVDVGTHEVDAKLAPLNAMS